MRLILIGLLALAPALTCIAATAGQDDQFAQLVRKPTNGVCPFDGNPINARLQPVPILGADGQEVLVGTCSQSCNDSLHLKSFGDEGRTVAAAAKGNTTVDRVQKGAGASTAGVARGPATQPAPAFGQPAPAFGQPAPAPAFGQPVPATHNGGSDLGASPKSDPKSDPKSEKIRAAKPESSKPRANSNDPDERQRAKKAAQRRDRGSSSRSKAGGMDSDEENDRRVK